MADNNSQGRGWHSEPEEHSQVAREDSQSQNSQRGLADADQDTRERVAQAGGESSDSGDSTTLE